MAITRKIRGLTIEFGADATNLLKGLSEVENKLRKTSTLYKDMDKLLKLNPKNVEVLAQKQGELTKAIGQTKDKLEQLKKIEAQMKLDGVKENSDEMKALRREIIDTEQTLKSYESQLKKTDGQIKINTSNLGKFGNKMQDQGDKLKSIGNKLKGYGDKISNIGRKLTKALTVPLVGVGTASVLASSKFESGLAGVAKTSNMSQSQLKKFGDEISKLSRIMPQSTEEMLAVAEVAGQLGIADKDILSFTETMLKMGQATNLSAEEASTSLARFANVMGTTSEKYSNMGSAIVDLGNNFATTESEILELALRLSGTANQIGMTEANVFGLSTAMRSMNITAEAGGSAVSRVMQKINTSVISNSDTLETFAKTAGKSAADFAEMWKKEPQEALLLFLKGINRVNESGGDTITLLKDMEVSSIREVDAVSRLASNTNLLRDALKLSNKAYEENTALSKEAGIRNKTLASRFQMVKNQTIELGRQTGEILLPYVEKFMETAKGWIERFRNLDDGTKRFIVTTGALIAGIGPLVTIFGKGISLIGSLTGGVGTLLKGTGSLITTIAGKGGLTASLGGTGTALATAGKAIGTFFTGPIGIGVGVATVAAIGAIKHFRKSSIKEVDLMADGVSDGTKKALGGFLELHEESEKSLKLMMSSGQKVTSEGIEHIVSNYEDMKSQIVDKLTEQKDKSIILLQETLSSGSKLSDEEQRKMLESIEDGYNKRIAKTQESEGKIQSILRLASDEKRSLTEQEKNAISMYQNQMKEEGIRTLTETEEEYAIIRQRMKDFSGEITAQQSADIVKMSLDQKDKVIQTAEEEYNEKIKLAEQIRIEGTEEAQKAADEIIASAIAQKEQTIAEVEEQHMKVVESAKAQAEEHVENVNWETGEILSNWGVFKNKMAENWSDIKITASETWDNIKKGASEAWGNMKKDVSDSWNNIKGSISQVWSDMKKGASEIWNDMKKDASESWGNIKSFSSEIWESIKSTAEGSWDFMKRSASKTWDDVKKSIVSPIESAWNFVSDIVGKFKNAFSFSWSLPKFKLPRISVTKETGIFGIPYPKFSVSWNRMGGIFKQPTILPTLAGMQGFAEPSTGGEAIMPLDKLPSLIADAMDMVKSGQPQTIINYIMLDGKVIGKEVTDTVDNNLGRKSMRERLAGGL